MTTIETAASEIRKGDILVSWKGIGWGEVAITKKVFSNRGNMVAYFSDGGRWKMWGGDRVVIKREVA